MPGTIPSLNEVRAAAEGGDADAQYILGSTLYYDRPQKAGVEEAVHWLRQSAEQGNARAQYMLGMVYDKDPLIPQDRTEAVKWYRKAAEQGHMKSIREVGNAYLTGSGVPLDKREAFVWLFIVGQDEKTTDLLYKIAEDFSDEEFDALKEEAVKRAAVLLKRAEEKGYS